MHHKSHKKTVCPWILGLTMATALFALIALFGDLKYRGNDDSLILRLFMGFTSTELPTFHAYLHPVLLYPLRWLSQLFPGVAWFSWMQLSFLWFACAVSVKCIVACFMKRGHALWWGAVWSAAYLICLYMVYCCQITYTITAAILGAAAVLQLLSVDMKNSSTGQVGRALLLALTLTVLAYGLRQITALPILAFCILCLLYLGCKNGDARLSLAPLCRFAVVSVIVFGLLTGGRALEIQHKGMADYLRWQAARINVMDYCTVPELPDEALELVGWSRTQAALIDRWNFMDGNINTQTFEAVAEYHQANNSLTFNQRLGNAFDLIVSLWNAERLAALSYTMVGALALLCAASLLHRRKDVIWQGLLLAAGLALAVALLLYLGWKGRLPLRAALTAMLPLAALVFGILPDCLPRPGDKAALPMLAVFTAVLLGFTVSYALPACREIARRPVDENDESTYLNPFQDLDELAASYPEYLFIYDDTFAADSRMFPSTDYGTPSNVLFWGGWGWRSPEYEQCLAAFGLDADTLDATVFLREDVYLARGALFPEPTALIARISELTGKDVGCFTDMDWGGAHTFQFYADE